MPFVPFGAPEKKYFSGKFATKRLPCLINRCIIYLVKIAHATRKKPGFSFVILPRDTCKAAYRAELSSSYRRQASGKRSRFAVSRLASVNFVRIRRSTCQLK